MSSVLFTFETVEERDNFVKESAPGNAEVMLDPVLECNDAFAVYVGGSEMYKGSRAEMDERFGIEVNAHSASVVLKQLVDDKWQEVRSRRRQPT